MIAAIIPAAGTSARMGARNKLLLEFAGASLIERAVDTLASCDIDEIVVVVGHEAEKVSERLEGKRVTIVHNPRYGEGMSTSIKAGLAAVSPEAGAIVIHLADQPLLEPGDVNRLIEAFAEARDAGKSIVVPFHQGRRGNPVILDARHRDAISEVVGDVGCRRVIEQNPDEVFVVEMDTDHVVRDVDRIEDYEALPGAAEEPRSS
jgi:molybdenum cofactor cytidylyltransferase